MTVRRTDASYHLDLIRGLAALAVLIYHVRYCFFLDFGEVSDRTLWANVFYTITAFGHDAVMVFFVLSGYLISDSIAKDCRVGRWSWRRYATNRLTRLYVVLIPGLLLTLLWDTMGLHWYADHAVYSGARQEWTHDFVNVGDRLTTGVFIDNMLFFQTIRVPPFGSNVPLWSLAFEFWYYCLFPCLFVGVVLSAKWRNKLLFTAAALVLVTTVNWQIVLYFPIWLMGTAIAFLPRWPRLLRHGPRRWATLAAGAMCVSLVIAGHVGAIKKLFGNSTMATDFLTGLGCALFFYVLLHHNQSHTRATYRVTAGWLSRVSYTLYVVHMPLLVFLRAALNPGKSWAPEPKQMLWALGLAAIGVVYALAIYWMAEAHTDRVRDFVSGLFRQERAAVGSWRYAPRPDPVPGSWSGKDQIRIGGREEGQSRQLRPQSSPRPLGGIGAAIEGDHP